MGFSFIWKGVRSMAVSTTRNVIGVIVLIGLSIGAYFVWSKKIKENREAREYNAGKIVESMEDEAASDRRLGEPIPVKTKPATPLNKKKTEPNTPVPPTQGERAGEKATAVPAPAMKTDGP